VFKKFNCLQRVECKFCALMFASLFFRSHYVFAKLVLQLVIARATARASTVVCCEATLHGQL
jgi:hypothetical protein